VEPEVIFDLRDVSFAYPGMAPALCDVTLQVRRGESVALLGANASGKSTLLQLLDGLQFPTQGTIEAFGLPLTEDALQRPDFTRLFRQRVGMMFQHSEVQLFCATVEEELAFAPLQLRLGAEEVQRRVEDTLELLEIAPLRDRSPQTLSGGERKRVALGGLLTASPQVLLLDEPTSGLDPRSQQWLLELLAQLREAGLTVIAASHDLELAAEIADRGIVLSEQHEVVADGPVREIVRDLDLLLQVNLIHAHAHAHGTVRHVHPHLHGLWHEHEHGNGEPHSHA
jgi:cobalt/nickel transport system ATP-binding protein